MLDSAGKRVAEQGQLQFLAERRERLDIPNGCWQRIPRARRSHRKRAVAEGGSTCQWQDQCRRRSRPETATWSHISVQWSISARYRGTVPCRQRCVRTHSRNWILSGTFSQCSSWRSGVVCSDLLTEKTSRAAAFSGSTMCQIWWKSNINIYISIYQINQYIK